MGIQRERRLVVEYVREKWPKADVWFNVRLGKLPAEWAKALPAGVSPRIFKVRLHYADAIVLLKDKVIIIETKIRYPEKAVAQLLAYKDLFYQTSELIVHHRKPVELLLVMAQEDLIVRGIAQKMGIRVDVYTPEWVKRWLLSLGEWRG